MLRRINNFLISHFGIILTIASLAFAYVFIFSTLDTSLVISPTTVTGGDTGSHVYIPYFLKQIFPLIKWWSPDWYSGFPFLYFYPPLLYVLTVILSYIIPLNISFKLIIFSVVLLYPLAFYLTLRWLNCKTPIPELGAVFSLFLIFLEKFSIYGGNLPSLLSGQFSHTASIAFLFMFIALMYKGVLQKKYGVFNILLGAAIVLSHPTSGLLLIILCPLFIFQSKEFKKNLLYVLFVYLGIFLITSFWTLSLLYYQGFSGVMKWTKEIKLDYLLPEHWLLLNASAVCGFILIVVRREIEFLGIIFLSAICLLAYFYLDNSSVWNTRFLPYILFSILLLAAYFLGFIISLFKNHLIITAYLATFLLMFFTFSTVKANTSYSPYWFKWNFEGYEAKQPWNEVDNLFSYLKSLPQGRVMWEYHPDYEKYGTPRILETIPVFTNQSTFEGLLIESGLTGPFHFINQTETSEKPTAAIAGFIYPSFDFNRGVKHLQMSGARYFVAYSEKVKKEADKNQNLTKLTDTYPFFVYEVKNSDLVEAVKSFTVKKKGKNWLNESIEWYKGENLDRPIVFAENSNQANKINSINKSGIGANAKNIQVTRDSIEFDVSKLNTPYIVKISYFPTWKASGASGPFLISPAYMMVIPTQNHVKLYFSYGWIDWLGIILSITGIGYLFFINKFAPKIFKKR